MAYASAFASASLPSKFQDVPGRGNFTNTITGLSRSWKFQKHNSRTFQVLEISQTQLQDFPGPGNFTQTIPGHSRRRGNPVC